MRSRDREPELPATEALPSRRRRRRTWSQRMLLAVNVIVITACFLGAVGLVVARNIGNSIGRVELADPSASTTDPPPSSNPVTTPLATSVETTVVDTAPVETFPPIDPAARNFLITGADNNACIDPNSPFAGAFGDREGMGERSDTIMLMRLDPGTGRGAVLSFPRDLWVEIAGRNSKQRINTAYVKDDPQRLIDTIYKNFGLSVDHFIQVDFCAFKNIVDAVGGVAVPFEYPARDTHSGLNVPEAGCFTFDGDHALAYVRSRYYEYFDGTTWKRDPVSDLGRVSRQQDFIRRAMSAALGRGILNPSVARGLIRTAQDNVVVDSELTLDLMLRFVGVLRSLDPNAIATYQVEAEGANVGGASVLIPRIKGANMRAILAVFRGEAPLVGAPEQILDSTTTTSATATTTTGATTVTGPTTTVATTTTVTTTTVAGPTTTAVEPVENAKGVVPPRDAQC